MTRKFFETAFTPDVLAAQRSAYGRSYDASAVPGDDALGPSERDFIAGRDSFYLATVSETGWPYVQHRGGDPGFLRVLDERTLAFADLAGNRQLVSTGNLAGDDRVSLFLMDYPGRRRLKILGRAAVRGADEPDFDRVGKGAGPVERAVVIHVVAFDWNCPKYITPRYTEAEVAEHTAALRARIAELEGRILGPTADGPDDGPG